MISVAGRPCDLLWRQSPYCDVTWLLSLDNGRSYLNLGGVRKKAELYSGICWLSGEFCVDKNFEGCKEMVRAICVDALKSISVERGEEALRPYIRTIGKACRVCGCTEFDACLDEHGHGCHWVESDLCSSCVGKA